jgi:hypothetical protein
MFDLPGEQCRQGGGGRSDGEDNKPPLLVYGKLPSVSFFWWFSYLVQLNMGSAAPSLMSRQVFSLVAALGAELLCYQSIQRFFYPDSSQYLPRQSTCPSVARCGCVPACDPLLSGDRKHQNEAAMNERWWLKTATKDEPSVHEAAEKRTRHR